MNDTSWTTTEFSYPRADGKGTHQVAGSTFRGIGLHESHVAFIRHEKKRLLYPVWSVTHLNSGHRICFVAGGIDKARPIAREIAEALDWTVRADLIDRPAAGLAVHALVCEHHPFAFFGNKPPKQPPVSMR